MLILGLTGSIGMGKTTVANMFRQAGIPVHDSDAVVHSLYAGDAVPLIEASFPGTTRSHAVDRALLGQLVLGNAAAMKKLEDIVHPMVARHRKQFLLEAFAQGHECVVLDIPLLFETGAEGLVDRIIVVSASPAIQRARVLARQGMSAEKFDQILTRQLPDAEKRDRADFVIHTDFPKDQTRRQVQQVIRECAEIQGAKYRA